MIKFRLQCERAHVFDAWFASSASFDEQAHRGLVACPDCASTTVEKALMAPSIVGGRHEREPAQGQPRLDRTPQQVASVPRPRTETERDLLALMRKIRDDVRERAEYVGPRFVEEARRIHHDEAPNRGIYGEGSVEDVRQLREDGIEVYPLPILPDDHN